MSIFASIDDCCIHLRTQFSIVTEIVCDYSDVESARLDLYQKLKQVRQDSFDDDQRLLLILERDFYDDSAPAGAVLQLIQTVIQDIDISNFFVAVITSNPDVIDEHQYIMKNISWDPVPFHVYQCQGSFERVLKSYGPMLGKLHEFEKLSNVVQALTDRQKHLLFRDEVFCMMPWIGININTNSETSPCCLYRGDPIGDASQQSIKEIWNSDAIKDIRLKMLKGQKVDGCHLCYHKESLKRDSLRNSINRDFAHHADLIDVTQQSGHLASTDILYWDIRYNNLCNFACRSCGPDSSSSWYQVHSALNPNDKSRIPLLQAGQSRDLIFDQICQHLDCVEKIYFAGGEPTMIENFYRILELLLDRGRNDVKLVYNINLSRLSLKDRSILDLWKQFDSVSVGASLDAMGTRAEYLRTGTQWDDIVENRRLIQQHCPHVDFYVSATTGLINALHVADFHQTWTDQGLIAADDFNIQLLYSPQHLSVINAPDRLKQKIIDRYQQHLDWLTPLDRFNRATSGFRSIIELCKHPGDYDAERFWYEIKRLDQYHNTDLLSTFSELQNTGL